MISTLPEIPPRNTPQARRHIIKFIVILLRCEEQVNEFYQVRVMRWKGGWAARVPTPLVYTPATLAPRNPINSWQAAPWRRGAGRYRVLIKLLRFATRRRAVLGATFLDSDDSFGHLNPEAGLSGDVRASG